MQPPETNSMPEFWRGRKVLITGHTGFKGAWLALLLRHLGAEVHGLALPPPTEPNLFTLTELSAAVNSRIADIRELQPLTRCLHETRPEIVFHLAAQALVRESYRDPVTTMATNVMGTVNLLEAARHCPDTKAVVVVTTDKCYENSEADHPRRGFQESDKLGGHDPYSASKACAEIVAQSYQRSFCTPAGTPAIATARAGNVIGGGDWAMERLLPDFFRAAAAGQPLVVRSPDAVRPWQHVLDALWGYLCLAYRLSIEGRACAEAWNFGPAPAAFATVRDVIEIAAEAWGAPLEIRYGSEKPAFHEAAYLTLDSAKASARLGWQPCWDCRQAVAATVHWHKSLSQGSSPQQLCLRQVQEYLEAQKCQASINES